MSDSGARKIWMTLLAILLLPTAYGMITQDFLLAGVCVGGMVVVRAVGLRQRDES